MKKLIILSIVVVISITNFAQKNIESSLKYLSFDEIDKAKSIVDLAANNENLKELAKTWYCKAKVYHTIYDQNLVKREIGKEETEGALIEAVESYITALNLDNKQIYTPDIINSLKVLREQAVVNGKLHFKNKNYSKANLCYEQAFKIDRLPYLLRNDAELYYDAGIVCDRLKMYDYAKAYYKIAARMNYEVPNVYLYLANIYNTENDIENEIKVLEQGANTSKSANDKLILLDRIVNCCIEVGKTENAIYYLSEINELWPDGAHYYYIKGKLLASINEIEQAEESFLKALDLSADFYAVDLSLGKLYISKGKETLQTSEFEKAKIHLSRFLQQYPENKVARQAIEYINNNYNI